MTRDDFERVQATTSYGKYKATTYIVYVLMKGAVELLEFQAWLKQVSNKSVGVAQQLERLRFSPKVTGLKLHAKVCSF